MDSDTEAKKTEVRSAVVAELKKMGYPDVEWDGDELRIGGVHVRASFYKVRSRYSASRKLRVDVSSGRLTAHVDRIYEAKGRLDVEAIAATVVATHDATLRSRVERAAQTLKREALEEEVRRLNGGSKSGPFETTPAGIRFVAYPDQEQAGRLAALARELGL